MKIFLLILILLPSLCFPLTFKKDGSIISSSGEIQRESIPVRYQKALEQYNNGDEISSGPTSEPGYQAIDPNTGEAPKP